jgi:hypothetical protein
VGNAECALLKLFDTDNVVQCLNAALDLPGYLKVAASLEAAKQRNFPVATPGGSSSSSGDVILPAQEASPDVILPCSPTSENPADAS